MKKFLGISDITLNGIKKTASEDVGKVSKKDIAIIGICGRFAGAKNIGEFWEALRIGKDMVRAFPQSRLPDIAHVFSSALFQMKNPEFAEAGYLDEIDKFDYSFFNLSLNEAKLMDPNQRVFLETVWGAIEDAGYGGNNIKGSRTGVYLGYSSDLKFEYSTYIQLTDPSMQKQISIPGNIKSIIASRISYILDLRGPSMVVDTACSSSLTAVHLACRAIVNNECEMAVAGAVKLHLLPLTAEDGEDIGVRSLKGRVRTFDDSADGICSGEGVCAVLLKPLNKAISDRDNIYAVIKGSAVNQDGSSIGITAPNPAAQEDVILRAWKNADIAPETISYIEAHGTATRLGDPVEIEGVQSAFRRYTDKKQFCAIGSVKTNLGHLDNAAGITSLVKAAMVLKHGEIPPSINFERPSRRIDFVDTPVYVNDSLTKWEDREEPHRCAVSSFGLSGTNCHMVLEEYREKNMGAARREGSHTWIFTLSAKNKTVLFDLVKSYRHFLEQGADVDVGDLCFTACSGRGHYNYRLAMVVKSLDDLKQKLDSIDPVTFIGKDVYYGEYRIVSSRLKTVEEGQITEDRRAALDEEARLKLREYAEKVKGSEALFNEICALYVKGADIDWNEIYRSESLKRVSLPTYPFKRDRCWIDIKHEMKHCSRSSIYAGETTHPLFDFCLVETLDQEIYSTNFSADRHWVLSEHKIAGRYIVPGTTYLEMIRYISHRHFSDTAVELRNVIFVAPVVLNKSESREIQTVIKYGNEFSEFVIASKASGEKVWTTHVEGRIQPLDTGAEQCDLHEIKRLRATKEFTEDTRIEGEIILESGKRWNNVKKVYYGENEFLVYYELPQEFAEDLKEYYLHPALMDRGVNVANSTVGAGPYLPLSYKSIKIYGPTPKRFYSYLRRKDAGKGSLETACFDITMTDESGRVFADITDYTIKKVHEVYKQFSENKSMYHKIDWIPSELQDRAQVLPTEKNILILKDRKGMGDRLAQILSSAENIIYEAIPGAEYRQCDENKFVISGCEQDYHNMMLELKDKNITDIVHLFTIGDPFEIEDFAQLEQCQKNGLYSLFYLTQSLIKNKINSRINIYAVSEYANDVTKDQYTVNPHNAAFFGLGKVVGQEYPSIRCKCIDIDEETGIQSILDELGGEDLTNQVAYRGGKRFLQQLGELDLKSQGTDCEIKEDNVYIITGGTGGIGLEIGKYLALKNRVKLNIISRTTLPLHERWDSLLETGCEESVLNVIRTLREIEKTGTEVNCFSADIAKEEEVKPVIASIIKRYGKINGIIHCAGSAGDGYIFKKQKNAFEGVVSPKLCGTWILDRLTREYDIDFFILFSSITSIAGSPGQGDYTAANAYLDSFAAYRNRYRKNTTVINWTAWKDTGMAYRRGMDENSKGVFRPISTENAVASFDEVINSGIGRVIIGELDYKIIETMQRDFPVKISPKIRLKLKDSSQADRTGDRKEKQEIVNIKIEGRKGEEFSTTERKIAAIWSSLLGLEEVNVYSSFSEVGGDSILATRLLKEMEKDFAGLIDISDIFTYPTINDMAEYIDSKTKKDTQIKEVNDFAGDDIDDVLRRLASGELKVNSQFIK